MSQVWKGSKIMPVTLIEAGPCTIAQIKTKEKDGYNSIQLGFGNVTKKNKLTKSVSKKPFTNLVEFRVEETTANVGDIIDLSSFEEGQIVKVSGISKGKGNQGPTKRYGFRGAGSATHGNKHNHRTTGSIGSRWPQRVVPGKKMAGRMGGERNTISNLEIVKIDKENNILAVKGAVPGGTNTLLEIVAK